MFYFLLGLWIGYVYGGWSVQDLIKRYRKKMGLNPDYFESDARQNP